jgi:hypothetical protein
MRTRDCWLLILTVLAESASAQSPFPVSVLSVDGIYGTRAGDPAVYCVLGANACVIAPIHNAWTDDPLLRTWIKNHPKAIVVPVSTRNWLDRPGMPPAPRIYVWIQDERESLNVALVREGRYPGRLMEDMVDAKKQLDQQFALMERDPRLAQFRDQLEKEISETPQESRPRRLISDSDYMELMERTENAELEARKEKKGMWSDAGLAGRSPPRDQYLIDKYRQHKDWFTRIRSLTKKDPRLAQVNGDAETWAAARNAGVDSREIQGYASLLLKLGANERLTGVQGIGEVCLVVADITYGLLDNGVIKGYVFAPVSPVPIVGDLDDSPGESATKYRLVDDNWYLFEVQH